MKLAVCSAARVYAFRASRPALAPPERERQRELRRARHVGGASGPAGRLGHATITETMDTYGHLFPDAEDLGRGAIDAIFAVALTEQERNQET